VVTQCVSNIHPGYLDPDLSHRHVKSMALITPQELVEMIIDYLHDDKRALGTCGLVCRFWLPSSRFHLFSNIFLNPWNMDKALAVLCTPDSFIPPYVRCVGIVGGEDMKQIFKSLQQLPPLSAVKSLSLCHIHWDSQTFLLLDKVFPFFPNLKTLRLSSVIFETYNMAFEFLSSAMLLECLYLGPITIGPSSLWDLEEIDTSSLTRFPLPPLKQIIFERRFYRPALFDWLQLGRPVASVNSVTLHAKLVQTIESVSGFLRMLGPVLEHLVIVDLGHDSKLHGMYVSVISAYHGNV
jgi:hypothetical protein